MRSIILIACCTAVLGDVDGQANVHLKLVDSFGNSVPFRATSFVELGGGKNMAAAFQTGNTAKIPEGLYRYTLTPQNAREWFPAQGQAYVLSSDVLIVSQALPRHPGRIVDTMGYLLQGKIQSRNKLLASDLWVRLLSPYSAQGGPAIISSDSAVSQDGLFTVRTSEPGNYVLVVCKSGIVLRAQPVTVPIKNKSELVIYVN